MLGTGGVAQPPAADMSADLPLAFLAPVVTALGHSVNRLVLGGPAVVFAGLASLRQVRTVPPSLRDVEAHATVPADRLSGELVAAGWSGVRRGDVYRWRGPAGAITIASVAAGQEPSSDEAVAREYAILLTVQAPITHELTIRRTSNAAQFALWGCQAARLRGPALVQSAVAEDLVELAMRDEHLEAGLRTAPHELREIVQRQLARVLGHDAFAWIVARLMRDGRSTPRVEQAVLRQIRKLVDA